MYIYIYAFLNWQWIFLDFSQFSSHIKFCYSTRLLDSRLHISFVGFYITYIYFTDYRIWIFELVQWTQCRCQYTQGVWRGRNSRQKYEILRIFTNIHDIEKCGKYHEFPFISSSSVKFPLHTYRNSKPQISPKIFLSFFFVLFFFEIFLL